MDGAVSLPRLVCCVTFLPCVRKCVCDFIALRLGRRTPHFSKTKRSGEAPKPIRTWPLSSYLASLPHFFVPGHFSYAVGGALSSKKSEKNANAPVFLPRSADRNHSPKSTATPPKRHLPREGRQRSAYMTSCPRGARAGSSSDTQDLQGCPRRTVGTLSQASSHAASICGCASQTL